MSYCPQCFDETEGRQGLWCKPCKNALMRRNRPRYRDLSPEEKFKNCTRAVANQMQKRGKLDPLDCQRCGASRTQKHHLEYARPPKTIWLCVRCRIIIKKQAKVEGRAELETWAKKYLAARAVPEYPDASHEPPF